MTDLIQKIIRNSSTGAAIFLSKKHEKSINDMQKFAQIGKVSSGIIHDLTSPITALNMQMEMLDENLVKNPEFIRSIKDAVINVNNYSKIIKEYISGNKNKEKVNLNKEIQNAVELISYKAIKEGIQINFISDTQIETKINKAQLYQIIISLVSNAIEAFEGKNENKKIIIKLQKDKNFTYINVIDFGIGIKNTKRIFYNFYTTKQKFGGTGIGLSNVKYIVEKELNGKIEVSSQLNKGSDFKIIIPHL